MNTEDELNEELERGQRIAKDLVDHMITMGANAGTIPVFVNDEKYEITIRHIPITQEAA